MDTRADIAIVGGGIMGSALAYWLTRLEPTASVVVIERDPTYALASSSLSAASIRQQFTTPVNIRISQASIEFLRAAGGLLAVDESKPDIGLTEAGYLYLANDGPGVDSLRRAHAIQTQHGAEVALLTPVELAERFPWLSTTDLAAGSLGLRGEGWFDGYLLLTGLARKARSQGARFMRGEATSLEIRDGRVEAVGLADGSRLRCGYVVNAAGPWARSVAKLAGVELPVFARRRTVYVIACRTPLERAVPVGQAGGTMGHLGGRMGQPGSAMGHRGGPMGQHGGPMDQPGSAMGQPGGPMGQAFPLLIDPSGFWVRPEGTGFIAGLAPADDPDDAPLEPDYEAFESFLWPALAARVPAFEAVKLERAWAGYYEMNVFDHNGIVGLHPEIANLGFMNGFSGHGMQQGPVVGRGMAELILHGRFTTVDLAPLGYERLVSGRPLRELNVIG